MRTLKLILSGWQSVGLVVFFMLFFKSVRKFLAQNKYFSAA